MIVFTSSSLYVLCPISFLTSRETLSLPVLAKLWWKLYRENEFCSSANYHPKEDTHSHRKRMWETHRTNYNLGSKTPLHYWWARRVVWGAREIESSLENLLELVLFISISKIRHKDICIFMKMVKHDSLITLELVFFTSLLRFMIKCNIESWNMLKLGSLTTLNPYYLH